MSDKMVGIDEVVEGLNKDVAEFKAFWRRMMEVEPESFPGELPEGEWWEQFMLWQQCRSTN